MMGLISMNILSKPCVRNYIVCFTGIMFFLLSYAIYASMTRISVNTAEEQSIGGGSQKPFVTANGRYILFFSKATNLVDDDSNNVEDLFLRDTQTGVTTRLSFSADGTQIDNQKDVVNAIISADGRFVALHLRNFNNQNENIPFDYLSLIDLQTNTKKPIGLLIDIGDKIDRNFPGNLERQPVNVGGVLHDMTPDGRFIVFTNDGVGNFLYDSHKDLLIELNFGFARFNDEFEPTQLKVSADGRHIAYIRENHLDFRSIGQDFDDRVNEVFVYDRDFAFTQKISVAFNGEETNGIADNLVISADGRYVAFDSDASNLSVGDVNEARDVFVYDRAFILPGHPLLRIEKSDNPSLSTNGRYIAYESFNNISSCGSNTACTFSRIFLHDIEDNLTALVSSADSNAIFERNPVISGNGRFVAYDSEFSGVVANDTNNNRDVFLKEITTTPLTQQLSLVRAGRGVIFSVDGLFQIDSRIICLLICSSVFPNSSVTELIALPFIGYKFLGWSGACQGDDIFCQLTMDNVKHVGAEFIKLNNDIIFDFGSSWGIWAYSNNSNWNQLHTLTSNQMEIGDIDGNGIGDLLIDFGAQWGTWTYSNNSDWSQLHPFTTEQIVTGDLDGNGQVDVAIDFGPQWGIWTWINNQTWAQLHTLSSVHMLTADLDATKQDELIVDFGDPWSLWALRDNTAWNEIFPQTNPGRPLLVDLFATGDTDGNGWSEMIMNFQAIDRLQIHADRAGNMLHPFEGRQVVTGDLDGNGQDEAIVDFGAPWGMWIWANNRTWSQLHTLSAEQMVVGDLDSNGLDDVIIDLGSQWGVWAWMNNNSWIQLHSLSPENMVVGDIDGQ